MTDDRPRARARGLGIVIGAAIILTSLWPINALAERLRGTTVPELQLRLALERVEAIGDISTVLGMAKIDIASLQTQRLARDSYRADLSVRGRSNAAIASALEAISKIPGVDIVSTSRTD